MGQALTDVHPQEAPSPLNRKIEYLVFALEEETAAEAVVGSIIRAFRRLKNGMSQKMSACSYTFHNAHNFSTFLAHLDFRPVSYWHRMVSISEWVSG